METWLNKLQHAFFFFQLVVKVNEELLTSCKQGLFELNIAEIKCMSQNEIDHLESVLICRI